MNEDEKAGYKWYHQKLKTSKGIINAGPSAEKYASKFGIRTMSGAYQNEATRNRIARAQKAYDDFIEGVSIAHQERYDRQHSDNPSILKPKLGKWIPVKAVKFLKSGITQIMK